MKPRDFLHFFKTKSGRLVAFGALFAAALVFLSVYRKRHAGVEDTLPVTKPATNFTDKPQVVQSVQRPVEVFRPPVPRPEPPALIASPSSPGSVLITNASARPLPAPSPSHPVEVLAPISLFPETAPEPNAPQKPGPLYAPFGRLIPCETVITVSYTHLTLPTIYSV